MSVLFVSPPLCISVLMSGREKRHVLIYRPFRSFEFRLNKKRRESFWGVPACYNVDMQMM